MRVKRGFAGKRRHDKYRKLAEGFRGRRRTCFKIMKDSVEKSMQFATRDRRVRKRDFRSLWIVRVNAAARMSGLSYSKLIHGMKKADIDVDRKVLAHLAVQDPEAFAAIAAKAKEALE